MTPTSPAGGRRGMPTRGLAAELNAQGVGARQQSGSQAQVVPRDRGASPPASPSSRSRVDTGGSSEMGGSKSMGVTLATMRLSATAAQRAQPLSSRGATASAASAAYPSLTSAAPNGSPSRSPSPPSPPTGASPTSPHTTSTTTNASRPTYDVPGESILEDAAAGRRAGAHLLDRSGPRSFPPGNLPNMAALNKATAAATAHLAASNGRP
eukprot:TRINITY_DN17186_c0_g1_i2.p1 TRINITY_DN17186_c0_g1~~TRINITY_DN17186_c0_g1_i2.p1  ORF type:complete len:210 (+),score=18.61 TRINITY_DN17186_c0_g1_i2:387-1016(+)